MIIHKMWKLTGKRYSNEHRIKEGRFFLGFIPIYIKTTKFVYPA